MKKSLVVLITTLTLNSCLISKSIQSSKAKTEFTEENNAIPVNFGENSNEILLAIEKSDDKAYNGFLKRGLKKNYFGNYKIVKKIDLIGDEYNDLNKYRYFFDYDNGSYYRVGNESGYLKRYYVYDRLTKTKYKAGSEFTFYAKALKIYLSNLEQKRLSNK